MTETNLQIVELSANNVMRLKAVTIRPKGQSVVLAGNNGEGKTSVLNCIAMAFGGGSEIPEKPIRDDELRGDIRVDLGDMIVTRTFTTKGSSVKITNKDGARYDSPQRMLDDFVGKLTFDPLSFSREKPKERAELIRSLVGLDFTEHDKARQEVFDERASLNREIKRDKPVAESMPYFDDAPDEPVSLKAMAADLDKATQEASHYANQVDILNVAEAGAEQWNEQVKSAEEELEQAKAHLAAVMRNRDEHREMMEAQRKKVATMTKPTSPEEFSKRLTEAEGANLCASKNQDRKNAMAAVAAKQREAEGLTAKLAKLDEDKKKAIAAAPMPIDGLGFSESGGVTLDGIPFEQASAAQQLRVSVAIGIAMNPKLRVLLVRDAALLDDNSMEIMAKMAADAGAQLWIERIAKDKHTTVVIEDGTVSE